MLKLSRKLSGYTAEYALNMASTNLKFGRGSTKEVGMDLKNRGAKRVLLVTDKNLVKLPPVLNSIKALEEAKVEFEVYDQTRVEPTDSSFMHAIEATRVYQPDAILAVGGGSAMDTAKAMNLYYCHPEAELLDFVNAPIGKAKPVLKQLLPLVCVTTTAGTGSETTGMTIFDYEPLKAKTGIGSPMLKPTLGIIDSENLRTASPIIQAYTGFDVLCHALESYTAISWRARAAPKDPMYRPTYQGRNHIADVWSLQALKMIAGSFEGAVYDADPDCQETMHEASMFAGMGFGNAGVHLCHGLSYPISGLIKQKSFKPDEPMYGDKPIVPHGLAVCITAPAVFEKCATADDETAKRCLEGAHALTGDHSILGQPLRNAGPIIKEVMNDYMVKMKIPNGISALGYDSSDVDDLIKGAMPQRRVLDLSPIKVDEDIVGNLFVDSLTNY